MNALESSALTTLVFLLFASVHSLCVTTVIKSLMEKALGSRFMKAFYRFMFTIFSIIAVSAAIYAIYLIPDTELLHLPAWLAWSMRGIQLAGLLFGLLSFKNIDGQEFLGTRQVLNYIKGNISESDDTRDTEGLRQEFIRRGVYGMVRHPLYLAGILIFTFSPDLTVNRVTITVLADMYFVYGALIEERRLVKRFGEEYLRYKQEVPRFIPRPADVFREMRYIFSR